MNQLTEHVSKVSQKSMSKVADVLGTASSSSPGKISTTLKLPIKQFSKTILNSFILDKDSNEKEQSKDSELDALELKSPKELIAIIRGLELQLQVERHARIFAEERAASVNSSPKKS